MECGRRDCSLYGLASDGRLFVFVMITHEGVLKLSRTFDISRGELETVLGCLRYILKKTVDMKHTASPKREDGQKNSVDGTADFDGDWIDLDNN